MDGSVSVAGRLRQAHVAIADELPSSLELLSEFVIGTREGADRFTFGLLLHACGRAEVIWKSADLEECFTAGYLGLCRIAQLVAPAKFRKIEAANHHFAAAKWAIGELNAISEAFGFNEWWDLRNDWLELADTEEERLVKRLPAAVKRWAKAFVPQTIAEKSFLKIESVQAILVCDDFGPPPQAEVIADEPTQTSGLTSNTSNSSNIRAVFFHDGVPADVREMARIYARDPGLGKSQAARLACDKFPASRPKGIVTRFDRHADKIRFEPPLSTDAD